MADTYENNLGQKSSLTTSDYIRVVGSDNASYKQLVSDVAKKIIEDYTGSSLAGSSQSVKSALDSLNSKTAYAITSSITASEGVTLRSFTVQKVGRIAVMRIQFDVTEAKVNGDQLFTGLPENYRPTLTTYTSVQANGGSGYLIGLQPSGNITAGGTGVPVKTWFTGSMTYVTD